MKFRHILMALAVTGGFGLAAPAQAALSSLGAQWFTLQSGHSDTNVSVPGLTTGLVENNLGPNGLPVRSAFSGLQPVDSSNNIKDINPVTNELLWWTPGSRSTGTVTTDGFYPSTISIPYTQTSDLFPGGASSNGGANGFLSARFSGTFLLPAPGSITLSLGADDDAWIFIDGVLAYDLGGVKPLNFGPIVTDPLAAGLRTIDIFFADRNTVQAGLQIDASVTFTPVLVPAPGALALLGLGLLGLGAARRMRAAA